MGWIGVDEGMKACVSISNVKSINVIKRLDNLLKLEYVDNKKILLKL